MFGSSKISRMQTMSLNSITANIMIADADLNIRYMNEAVTALLKEAETDLKKELRGSTLESSSAVTSTYSIKTRRISEICSLR